MPIIYTTTESIGDFKIKYGFDSDKSIKGLYVSCNDDVRHYPSILTYSSVTTTRTMNNTSNKVLAYVDNNLILTIDGASVTWSSGPEKRTDHAVAASAAATTSASASVEPVFFSSGVKVNGRERVSLGGANTLCNGKIATNAELILDGDGSLTFAENIGVNAVIQCKGAVTLIFKKEIGVNAVIKLDKPGDLSFEGSISVNVEINAPEGSTVRFKTAPSTTILNNLRAQRGVTIFVAGVEQTMPTASSTMPRSAVTFFSTSPSSTIASVSQSAVVTKAAAAAAGAGAGSGSSKPIDPLIPTITMLENGSIRSIYNGQTSDFPLGERNISKVYGSSGAADTLVQIMVTETIPPNFFLKAGNGVRNISAFNNCINVNIGDCTIDSKGSVKAFNGCGSMTTGALNIWGSRIDDSIFNTPAPEESPRPK